MDDASSRHTVTFSKPMNQGLALEWGWNSPPQSIVQLAELASTLMEVKSGEALLQIGLIDKRELNDLLEDQKLHEQSYPGIKFLEFAAQRMPQIRSNIDRILTLRKGIPFYESLTLLKPHGCLYSQAVYLKCESLDAVVMEIEGEKPVVIFSTFQAMHTYLTAGRYDKTNDPIRVALLGQQTDANILVAVGNRSEITKLLHDSKSKNVQVATIVTESMWHANSVTEEYQRTLARLLDSAIELEATDIDINPLRTGGSENFMRRFGDLVPMPFAKLTEPIYRQIVNFLMQRSNANMHNTRLFIPADGRLTYRSNIADVFLRLSFIPLNHPGSETDLISVSIRIFPRTENIIELEDLNIDVLVRKEIAAAAKFDHGLILACGGTNTGKSTLIAGAIGENIKYYGSRKKRISIEQPIERYLAGVKQVNVNERVMKDDEIVDGFELMLRAIKRHDPNVIYVGEVRDQFSADVCVASSISGHLVLSTIHANHTILGYDHLSKKVHSDHRYQLVESLSLLIGQKLVKKLCPHCKEKGHPTADDRDLYKAKIRTEPKNTSEFPEIVSIPSTTGCDFCAFTGYKGMLPVNEILPVGYDVKVAMLKMLNGQNALNELYEARTLTLFESAMKLVNSQDITLGDAIL